MDKITEIDAKHRNGHELLVLIAIKSFFWHGGLYFVAIIYEQDRVGKMIQNRTKTKVLLDNPNYRSSIDRLQEITDKMESMGDQCP